MGVQSEAYLRASVSGSVPDGRELVPVTCGASVCAHYLFVNVQRRPARATTGGPTVNTGVRPTS